MKYTEPLTLYNNKVSVCNKKQIIKFQINYCHISVRKKTRQKIEKYCWNYNPLNLQMGDDFQPDLPSTPEEDLYISSSSEDEEEDWGKATTMEPKLSMPSSPVWADLTNYSRNFIWTLSTKTEHLSLTSLPWHPIKRSGKMLEIKKS